MDALGFLNALSGSKASSLHPVTAPDFLLTYEQKDITADIAPYLLSFTYTDYLGDQSDELQVSFEDVDGRWLRTWYPDQGDSLSLSCGDQFTGLVNWGSFEIAELEYEHSKSGGSIIHLKALSTGITKANRTLQAKAYENTTLAQIVRLIAKRLKLSVTGTVANIKIQRVTQYQERDVEFLTRLAKEYGHSFKIVGKTLVFTSRAELVGQKAVAVIDFADVLRIRLRDLIKGVPQAVEVQTYDQKKKQTRKTTKKGKPRRPNKKRQTTSDTLKIVANKGESPEQTEHRAQAALDNAQDEQNAGSLTVVGNALLVAGQMVELQNFGQFSGRYLVKQARHDCSKRGYTTELEIKMIEYLAENTENANANA
ncbi:phage late control D family protein [Kingella kingae]|uniref:phage late control D family protein n=1 Tax=Kingella kingae TaxID=504 RepID=UPI00254C48AC|nr:contractile injection system protein, VgrG/Pvc8 family [Kingella kingae]MDK4575409.1 contractile injection system protein, VgrG/Pvc8 family [Kingella kingae]MDK4607559.1 contractile injection system protein, VgrG/Pvc8 family [Kingella kingae]